MPLRCTHLPPLSAGKVPSLPVSQERRWPRAQRRISDVEFCRAARHLAAVP